MSGFFALHVRPIRNHPLRAMLSIGGVAIGVALMISMLGLFGSMSGAASKLANVAGDADIEVSAPNDGGLPEGLVAEVAAVPGVKVAAPIVRSMVSVDGSALMLFGLDERLGEIGGGGITLGECLPKQMREGEGVLVGPTVVDRPSVRIATPTGTTEVAVLGQISCGAARQLNAGKFVAAPLAIAELLTGRPNRPDAIEIKAEPGQAAAVTDAVTATVNERAIVASPRLLAKQGKVAVQAFQQGASIMVGLALVVGAFCVFNTVSMTALERRRELATLRAIGGHRRALLVSFLGEMALLGLIGSVAGVLLGQLAGTKVLIKRIPPILVDTVGAQPTFGVSRNLIIAAIVGGVIVTLGAAFMPARGAVSIEPVEAMRSEGPAESAFVDSRASLYIFLGGVGLYIAAVLVTINATSSSMTLVGFSTVVLASLIFQYGGRVQIAAGTARIAALFGNSGRLAAASIARAPRRTYATVTAVAVAVVTVVAIGGVTENQITTFTSPYKPMANTDVWLGTAEPNVIPVSLRFPDSMLKTVADVPGVASVSGSQSSYTTIGEDRVLLQGFASDSNVMTFAAMSEATQARLLDPTERVAAVTQSFADLQHLERGDTLTLRTPNGPLSLSIIEIKDVVAPSQSGIVALNLATLQSAFNRPGYTWIEAQGEPGVSRAELKARITAATRDSSTKAYAATGEEEYAGARGAVTSATALISAMEVAVVLGTAFALANALLISIIERRRELGIIRAIGTTRGQIRSMVFVEAGAIALMGIVIGSWQGMIQHRVGDVAVESLLNARVGYLFTLEPLFIVSLSVVGIAFVAGLVPAFRAGRTNVIEAIGYE